MLESPFASVAPVVALAGDWHRDGDWALRALEVCANRGIENVLHVGDFSFRDHTAGRAYLERLEVACSRLGITILVTPGNHEDWPLIDAWPVNDRGDRFGPVAWFTDHIAALPRGHRFTLSSTTFLSLGGAPSINFTDLTEGVDWHRTEMLTAGDVERVIAGGTADVMLTHDAPAPPWAVPAVEWQLQSNPQGWSDRELAYAKQGRDLVTEAFLGVAPRMLAHGHYHASGQKVVDLPPAPGRRDSCEVVALAANSNAHNLAFLTLDDLTIEWPDRDEWTLP